jgi:hypothetical protein
MIYNFDGNRLRYYTGKRIDLVNWDFAKQRAKTQCTEANAINGYLKKLARFVEETYSNEKIPENKPTVDFLREKLSNIDRPIIKTSFIDYFQEYIDTSKTSKSPSTTKKYTNALNHLKKFALKEKYVLEFNRIDSKFYDLYKTYLIDEAKTILSEQSDRSILDSFITFVY